MSHGQPTGATGVNQRANVRAAEPAVIRVRRADGRYIEAGLHDFSIGGALIESDSPIPAGEEIGIPLFDLEVRAIAQSARGDMIPLVFADLPPDNMLRLVKHVARKLDGEDGP